MLNKKTEIHQKNVHPANAELTSREGLAKNRRGVTHGTRHDGHVLEHAHHSSKSIPKNGNGRASKKK